MTAVPRLVGRRWGWWSRAPLRTKLRLITLATSFTVLSAGFLVIGVLDYLRMRQTMAQELRTLAAMIGDNLTGMILFEDRARGQSLLSELSNHPSISGAVVYNSAGKVFVAAKLKDDVSLVIPERPPGQGYEISGNQLVVARRLRFQNEDIGTIVIIAELGVLYQRMIENGLIVLSTLILLLMLAAFLASRLHHRITQPILQLADTARRVTEEQDFELRAEKISDDETGILAEQFNAMMEMIRDRDVALQREIVKLRRAEDSNRELQLFASVASHDLQEPLRKVQAFADRILSGMKDVLDERNRDYFDRMLNATKRMQRLINDLLAYSRITTRAQPFEPVHLGEVLDEVVADMEITIEQVRATVRIGPMPRIEADISQMRQLFHNLLGNALKYSKADAAPVVSIDAELVETMTPSQPERRRTCCRLVVRDNGIGFEQQYAEQIFVIFQRLHGKQDYQGTGIGLALCRKIVERHGGSIRAEGVPNRGAVFTVMLPVSHEPPPQDAASAEADSAKPDETR
jgi:signal transduction histidine kinase